MSLYKMPITSAYGQNSKPFDGAKLYFYEAGTTTPKTSYSDPAESIPNTNPVIADAKGRFPAIFISGLYKNILTDKNDVQQWEEDNISATGSGVNIQGNFDSSTNGGDYPALGGEGDLYIVTAGFTLNPASGEHTLQTRDFIIANKSGATAIDADWDIIRGVVSNVNTVALVDAANIATDCSKGLVFAVTIGGNRTLANPTNVIPGQTYYWKITQDGTGGRTLAFGANFDLPAGSDSSIRLKAADVTIVKGVAISTTNIQIEFDPKAYDAVALADGASIATDCSLGRVFSVTLGGNRTLSNPTNIVPGATYIWIITQDGTGSRTLAFDTYFSISGQTLIDPNIDTVTIVQGVATATNVLETSLLGKEIKGTTALSDVVGFVATDCSLGNVFTLSVAQTDLTSGALSSGRRYFIETYVASDDFTNVGAPSNATGVEFIASGTTPTDWTNGSTIRRMPHMSNPTNVIPGTTYTWVITQPAGGGVRVSFASDFKFSGRENVNVGANAVTVITGIAEAADVLRCEIQGSSKTSYSEANGDFAVTGTATWITSTARLITYQINNGDWYCHGWINGTKVSGLTVTLTITGLLFDSTDDQYAGASSSGNERYFKSLLKANTDTIELVANTNFASLTLYFHGKLNSKPTFID